MRSKFSEMNTFHPSTMTKVITNRMQSSLCKQYVIEESGALSDPDSCALFETFELTWYNSNLGLPIPSVLSLKSDGLIIVSLAGFKNHTLSLYTIMSENC